MRRLIITILSILFSMGCAGQNIKQSVEQDAKLYHNICPLHELLVQASDSVYLAQTIMTFNVGSAEELRECEEERTGMAFAINRHQLLTVAHLVSIDDYQVSNRFGTFTMFVPPEDKIKEETWLILENGFRILTKVIYIDEELDFAMLEVEDRMPLPVYSIGNSDDFRMLDQIFMISDEDSGKNIKSGHIMQLDCAKNRGEHSMDMFGLYLGVKQGASGSPILLIRGNRLEIGGIVVVGDFRVSGYAVKINAIMDRFRAWQNEREW